MTNFSITLQAVTSSNFPELCKFRSNFGRHMMQNFHLCSFAKFCTRKMFPDFPQKIFTFFFNVFTKN